MGKRAIFRSLSVAISAVYFATNCALAHVPETSVWSERRRSIKSATSGLQLAQLPGAVSLALIPALSAIKSALPRRIEASLPKDAAASLKPLFESLSSGQGTIRGVSLPSSGATNKVIIHIQDVHGNAE